MEANLKRLSGKEINAIVVKAHARINMPDATQSGNLYGMTLASPTGVAKVNGKTFLAG